MGIETSTAKQIISFVRMEALPVNHFQNLCAAFSIYCPAFPKTFSVLNLHLLPILLRCYPEPVFKQPVKIGLIGVTACLSNIHDFHLSLLQ